MRFSFFFIYQSNGWPIEINSCPLTLILLTRRIGLAPNKASNWQKGFNLAYKEIMDCDIIWVIKTNKILFCFLIYFSNLSSTCFE